MKEDLDIDAEVEMAKMELQMETVSKDKTDESRLIVIAFANEKMNQIESALIEISGIEGVRIERNY